ncbi:MAG: NUDIX domain-containing protein, partial [Chloroflexi bacterium]|nr:NUDIX domain-containing protein [Chloroflexota bacterium]
MAKGIVEPGEGLEQAARREVKEETGLDARVMDKLGESDYWFFSNRDRARVRKTVHFYLLECVGGDTAAHDWEVQDVKWVSLDEAMRVLTFK